MTEWSTESLLRLATETPSPGAWEALLQGLTARAERDGYLAYPLLFALRTRLAWWPDAMRVLQPGRLAALATAPTAGLQAAFFLARALPVLTGPALAHAHALALARKGTLAHEAGALPWARFDHVTAHADGEDTTVGWLTPLFELLDGAGLRSLSLRDEFSSEALGAVARETFCKQLEHLQVSHSHYELYCATWGEAFRRSPSWKRLKTLAFEGNPLAPRAVQGLHRGKFPALRTLSLGLMEGGGLRQLAAAPWAKQLRVLELRFSRHADRSQADYLPYRKSLAPELPTAVHLAPRDPLPDGASLLDRDWIHAVDQVNAWSGLDALLLSSDSLTQAGVEALARAPFASTLQVLHLQSAHPDFDAEKARACLRAAMPYLYVLEVYARSTPLPPMWQAPEVQHCLSPSELAPQHEGCLVRWGGDQRSA